MCLSQIRLRKHCLKTFASPQKNGDAKIQIFINQLSNSYYMNDEI